MVAGASAFRRLHVTQQRVHLGDGQRAIGAYCGVACHGGKQFIAARFDHGANAQFIEFCEHTVQQAFGCGVCQQAGYAAQRHGALPDHADIEAQRSQRFSMRFSCGDFLFTGANDAGDEQALRRDRLRGLRFQAFVDDAFVRGMHVNEHEAAYVLGEDVDAVQLCDCEA